MGCLFQILSGYSDWGMSCSSSVSPEECHEDISPGSRLFRSKLSPKRHSSITLPHCPNANSNEDKCLRTEARSVGSRAVWPAAHIVRYIVHLRLARPSGRQTTRINEIYVTLPGIEPIFRGHPFRSLVVTNLRHPGSISDILTLFNEYQGSGKHSDVIGSHLTGATNGFLTFNSPI
jgi:hypothetical protein